MPKSKQTRARKRSAKGHDEKASKAQKVSSTPLSVCGSDVRICHLSNDVAFASPPLNLSESDGFGKFISILVDWSLCDNDQRGYDPSMDSADEHGGWLIQCADVETGETNVYVSTAELASSDRLFGRHTRCFIAKQQIRGADGSTSYGPPVVVKDSWPSKLTDSALDETELLRMINDKLPKHAEGVMYPKLLACECVAFNYSSTGDVSNDTTTSILGNLHDDEDSEVSEDKHYIWFRGHKRYVTSPVGERLGTARSFDELAAAMADVMKTHEMARKHCDILHRDISHNNMMIVREKDHVRGLLIDYDASITQSELKEQSAPGRVGTFYCMSIGNLQNNTVPRTALDDWESLLYVICHYATTGVGSGRIVNWDEPAKRPIKKWVADSHDDAALFKKQHLASEKAFKDNITSHFRKTDKGGEKMVALAKSLHTMLFFNPRLNWICHGVDKRWGIIDGKRVYRDPFEARTENVDGIVNDLLAVMGQAQNSDIGGTSA
ncbi:hypothetical protein LPJ59_000636 [Coemansia sp. RSA 2399]|nr:hypothetical protein LPJ59_000636 [Coemansia sp. RSA 2399]